MLRFVVNFCPSPPHNGNGKKKSFQKKKKNLQVFCFRYLDLLYEFISLYNSVMKVGPHFLDRFLNHSCTPVAHSADIKIEIDRKVGGRRTGEIERTSCAKKKLQFFKLKKKKNRYSSSSQRPIWCI